ncbi:hypothetical protein TNCV_3626691 [Trichonephila clavipes]|nr:hypothetical protein TNCV_3626691 [Trichonephila clavipes]
MLSSSLDRGTKLRGPSPIAFVLLYGATLINTLSLETCGRDNRVVRGHEFLRRVVDSKPITAEDPQYIEAGLKIFS